jgi:hypothetical protein
MGTVNARPVQVNMITNLQTMNTLDCGGVFFRKIDSSVIDPADKSQQLVYGHEMVAHMPLPENFIQNDGDHNDDSDAIDNLDLEKDGNLSENKGGSVMDNDEEFEENEDIDEDIDEEENDGDEELDSDEDDTGSDEDEDELEEDDDDFDLDEEESDDEDS